MTVKAISATILLGAIPLDVYQLPDGGYKVDAIGVTAVPAVMKYNSNN